MLECITLDFFLVGIIGLKKTPQKEELTKGLGRSPDSCCWWWWKEIAAGQNRRQAVLRQLQSRETPWPRQQPFFPFFRRSCGPILIGLLALVTAGLAVA